METLASDFDDSVQNDAVLKWERHEKIGGRRGGVEGNSTTLDATCLAELHKFGLDKSYLAPLLAFARGCSEGVTRFALDIPELVRTLAELSRESSERRGVHGKPSPRHAMEELLGMALARHMLGSSLERELAGADEAILRHAMQHSMPHADGRLNMALRGSKKLRRVGAALSGESGDAEGGSRLEDAHLYTVCDRLATLDSATLCSLLLSESPFDAQAEIAELCAIKRLLVGEERHSIGFDHSSGFEPVAEQVTGVLTKTGRVMLKRPLAVAAWQAGAAAWLGELLVRIEEGLREQLITELEIAQAEGLCKPMLLSSVEGRGREARVIGSPQISRLSARITFTHKVDVQKDFEGAATWLQAEATSIAELARSNPVPNIKAMAATHKNLIIELQATLAEAQRYVEKGGQMPPLVALGELRASWNKDSQVAVLAIRPSADEPDSVQPYCFCLQDRNNIICTPSTRMLRRAVFNELRGNRPGALALFGPQGTGKLEALCDIGAELGRDVLVVQVTESEPFTEAMLWLVKRQSEIASGTFFIVDGAGPGAISASGIRALCTLQKAMRKMGRASHVPNRVSQLAERGGVLSGRGSHLSASNEQQKKNTAGLCCFTTLVVPSTETPPCDRKTPRPTPAKALGHGTPRSDACMPNDHPRRSYERFVELIMEIICKADRKRPRRHKQIGLIGLDTVAHCSGGTLVEFGEPEMGVLVDAAGKSRGVENCRGLWRMAKAFSDEALAVGRALEAAYPADQRAAALLRERPAPKGGLFMGLPELVVLLNFRPRDVALHSGEELLGYMLAAWPSYAANKDFADRGRGPSEATLLTFAIQTGDEALVRRAIALRDHACRWRKDMNATQAMGFIDRSHSFHDGISPPFTAMDVAMLVLFLPHLALELLAHPSMLAKRSSTVNSALNSHPKLLQLHQGEVVVHLEECASLDVLLPAALLSPMVDDLLATPPFLALIEAKTRALWPLYYFEVILLLALITTYAAWAVGGVEPCALPALLLGLFFGLVGWQQIRTKAHPLFCDLGARRRQLLSIHNVIDSLCTLWTPATIFMDMLVPWGEYRQQAAALNLLFLLLKFIATLRVYEEFGFLVQMLQETIRSMGAFALLVGIIIGGFAIIFVCLPSTRLMVDGPTGNLLEGLLDSNFSNSEALKWQLWDLYLVGTVGEVGEARQLQYNSWATCFFVVYTLVMNIVCLNVLVTIVGRGYSKAEDVRIELSRRTRAGMIVDLEATYLVPFFSTPALRRGKKCRLLNYPPTLARLAGLTLHEVTYGHEQAHERRRVGTRKFVRASHKLIGDLETGRRSSARGQGGDEPTSPEPRRRRELELLYYAALGLPSEEPTLGLGVEPLTGRSRAGAPRAEEEIASLRGELALQGHMMASHISRLETLVQERLQQSVERSGGALDGAAGGQDGEVSADQPAEVKVQRVSFETFSSGGAIFDTRDPLLGMDSDEDEADLITSTRMSVSQAETAARRRNTAYAYGAGDAAVPASRRRSSNVMLQQHQISRGRRESVPLGVIGGRSVVHERRTSLVSDRR